jgi:hypothetical protein
MREGYAEIEKARAEDRRYASDPTCQQLAPTGVDWEVQELEAIVVHALKQAKEEG